MLSLCSNDTVLLSVTYLMRVKYQLSAPKTEVNLLDLQLIQELHFSNVRSMWLCAMFYYV